MSSPVNRYTLGRTALGIILGLNGVSPTGAFALAVVWEVLEEPARELFPAFFPRKGNETMAHRATNVAATMLGWYAIKQLPPERTNGELSDGTRSNQ